MGIWSNFSWKIEKRNWDHISFLQLLTFVLILNLLIAIAMFYLFGTTANFDDAYVQNSIYEILYGTVTGLIAGLIIQFCILLYPYLKKNWDLHFVIPYSLFFNVLITVFLQVFFNFTNQITKIREIGIIIGFLIGGLLATIAYAGEVKEEHTPEDIVLDE